ncbi:death associated protein kinase 1 [Trichuris trichiura]|uniref:Death associated protein kinase 1 n=1 Tax=Trichuris trichiura TaxID=36087 RepID=A0A077ZF04_TRITR|nr:death associated protein kinase 1 [Trichuris trichiura]
MIPFKLFLAGETPLICSTIRGHLDCAFALKAAGVDFGETDGDGNSPLHLACKEGLSTLVRNLCQRGMDVDHVNQLGNAPLHIACQQNHLDIVKQLCLAECNVNLKDEDGRTGEMIASGRGHSEICELLKRVKQDSVRQCYIKQLVSCTGQPLRRIKLKLFGHSGVGKTRLLESLRTGLLGNLFRRFNEQAVTAVDEVLETPASTVWRRAVVLPPSHGNCTAGIEVTTSSFPTTFVPLRCGEGVFNQFSVQLDINNVKLEYTPRSSSLTRSIRGCAEFSTWEFSGYPTYHFLYDRFIGNPNCIHLVLFRATDPTEVKYHSVLFWMSLLKSCFSPENSISKSGVCQHRAVVILVATHVDMAEPAYSQTPDGEWRSSEAEALLKTIKLRFCNEFFIHDSIILVDTLQPSSPGIRTLKSLLLHHRSLILERLPSTSGFLESAVTTISQLRKQMASLPVLKWPDFLRYLHQLVNPLSSEFHCEHLAEQLQHIGEIVCVRSDNVYPESDFIVLNPNWLCHEIIGRLLSYEFLRNCRPTGIYTTDEILQLFPTVSDITEFSRLLEAVGLGTVIHSDGNDAFEFSSMNFSRPPPNLWEPVSTSFVYAGIRLVPRRGMDHLVRGLFLRVQNNLRRCLQQSKNPLDTELIQWQGGSKVSRGMIEGLLLLLNREHCLELRVRGPTDLNTDCFYFFEEILNLIERTVFDVSPGILLERHFLSPNDLSRHCSNVCVYTPNRIIEMQLEENVFIYSVDRKEQFLDIVCFGSREIAMSLKLGIDLKITAIPNSARRELASLLDPVDTMGRDWSILGAHLGLGNQLAEIESACGPEASTTDRVLSEWFLRNKDGATVGALLRCLKTMGRQDAVDILYRSIAPYLFVPMNCDFIDARNDSGVESHNSRSTVNTPDRSASTVST